MCERSTCGSKRARPTDLYAEEGLTFGNIRTNRSLELHCCSEGTVRALGDGGTLSPVGGGGW